MDTAIKGGSNECANSPEFEKIIDTVRDTIYDLHGLIELEKSRSKYACLTEAGPLERADRAILLTNKYTASAAEIFAAALQDHKKAIVAGEKTRCKGIGQLYFTQMPEGSWLAVNNMRLYSPSGKWLGDVQNTCNGVEPDFKIGSKDPDQIEGAKAQLRKGLKP